VVVIGDRDLLVAGSRAALVGRLGVARVVSCRTALHAAPCLEPGPGPRGRSARAIIGSLRREMHLFCGTLLAESAKLFAWSCPTRTRAVGSFGSFPALLAALTRFLHSSIPSKLWIMRTIGGRPIGSTCIHKAMAVLGQGHRNIHPSFISHHAILSLCLVTALSRRAPSSLTKELYRRAL
jgi:hypothetical protein